MIDYLLESQFTVGYQIYEGIVEEEYNEDYNPCLKRDDETWKKVTAIVEWNSVVLSLYSWICVDEDILIN